MQRYLKSTIKDDLERKMVFLGGPRQVGKTTLSKSLEKSHVYLNWDVPAHRSAILKGEISRPTQPNKLIDRQSELLIFDELHKYRSWRNYLKGIYDVKPKNLKILVTGSAKLDLLRRGGDSLQGRYHYHRLHPLSFAELKMNDSNDLKTLFNLSPFPEPFFTQSKKETNRWSREYSLRFFKDEVLSINALKDVGNLELLYDRLPELIGSPLSINAIREDLQVSHHTVSNWLNILEMFYGFYRLSPFGAPKIRAVKKEQKLYFFDWNKVDNPGARFENLVANHLLKWVHHLQDTEGRDLELRYFRSVEMKEVDFVVCEKSKPIMLVEVKLSDFEVSSGLRFLKAKFAHVPAFQISLEGKKDFLDVKSGIRVCPAHVFLKDFV